ncbi:hypothetical protein [Geodermatophilus sp. SYSU D00766]
MRRGVWLRLPWALLGLSVVLATLTHVLLWQDGRGDQPAVVLVTDLLSSLGVLGFAVVGAVVAARLPGSPIGWLCTGLSVAFWSSATAGALQAAGWVSAWPLGLLERLGFPLGIFLAVLLFLLFPTGRVPSPAWRWLARVAVVCVVLAGTSGALVRTDDDTTVDLPWALDGTAADVAEGVFYAGTLGLIVSWLAALVSMVPRYRRAGPVEREQLRWVSLAVLLNLAQLVIRPLAPDDVGVVYAAVAFAAVPVAIGIAVTRYRLFDIDRIVSRTVSYGVLTGGLLVLYLVAVTALRPLLTPLTGTSDLAVVVSTLAAAAAFGPVRRRVQAAVDRRFDRSRYDAARAVDAYARRLRTEVDLQAVTAGLRDTVTTTVGPQRVGLWLRDDAVARRA